MIITVPDIRPWFHRRRDARIRRRAAKRRWHLWFAWRPVLFVEPLQETDDLVFVWFSPIARIWRSDESGWRYTKDLEIASS